jgi:arginyl-tRNA synthetase
MFKNIIASLIIYIIKENKTLHRDITLKEAENIIKLPPDPSYGDYSIPAYYLAKYGFKGSPEEIASEFVAGLESVVDIKIRLSDNGLHEPSAEIEQSKGSANRHIRPKGLLTDSPIDDIKYFKEFFSHVDIKGAYINFHLIKEKFVYHIINAILIIKEDYGRNNIGDGKKVVIDFSSPNIAKPFGVGHLRSTAIGMSLANIYTFCGYNVTKINYIGDFGTQFGKLITAFCHFDDVPLTQFKNDPVKFLYQLYVRFHEEAVKKLELEDEARLRFKKLEKSVGLNNIAKGYSIEFYLNNIEQNINKNSILTPQAQNIDVTNSDSKQSSSENIDEKSKLIDILQESYSKICDIKNPDGEFTLWKLFRRLSIDEFRRIYNLIGISFDYYEGESESSVYVDEIVGILLKAGIAKKSLGAVIIPLSLTMDIGLTMDTGLTLDSEEKIPLSDKSDGSEPPALLAKSDGTSLYLSRDIVTAIIRHAKYNFDKMIYVVGSEQSLHFNQLFNVFRILNENKAKLESDYPFVYKYACNINGKLSHVKFGRIIGMSTRKGNLVFLEDYINEAKEKAVVKVKERFSLSEAKTDTEGNDSNFKPEFEPEEDIALKIGIGAVIFNDLKTRRGMDINFNWDNVLSFEGQTGPYLQYTVARINSLILRVCQKYRINIDKFIESINNINMTNQGNDFIAETEDNKKYNLSEKANDFEEIYSIVKHLSLLEDTIKEAALHDEPSILSTYLLKLASLFNKYYQNYKLLGLDTEIIIGRLLFLSAVKIVLSTGLSMLSVPILKRM